MLAVVENSQGFFLFFFSAYSFSEWNIHDLYNNNKSRGRGKEFFGAFEPLQGSVGRPWSLYLDPVLGVEVGGAQTGIEAVAQALQQPHSWEQLTLVLTKQRKVRLCFPASHFKARPSTPPPILYLIAANGQQDVLLGDLKASA